MGALNNAIEGQKTELTEYSRSYLFPARNIEIMRPRELIVRPSGTHRLVDADGILWVIPTGWLAIRIDDPDADGWTV